MNLVSWFTPSFLHPPNTDWHSNFFHCRTQHTHTHTRLTALFPGLPRWAGTRNLDFTEARDSEWQWHQLGRMQVCTSLQTDNHASTPPLSFYRPDALPAAQPIESKHWRQGNTYGNVMLFFSLFFSFFLSLCGPQSCKNGLVNTNLLVY